MNYDCFSPITIKRTFQSISIEKLTKENSTNNVIKIASMDVFLNNYTQC